MFSNDTAKLFSGNICLYQYQTRFRQRVFLQRNIDRALKYNEEQQQQQSQGSFSAVPAAQLESPPPAVGDVMGTRRPRIADIANRLKKEVAITGLLEPVLKIDLTTLRGKSDERRNSSYSPSTSAALGGITDLSIGMSDESSIRVSAMVPKRPKTLRCRCVLTIFGKATTPDTRSRAKGSDRNQLLRVSELCTIVMDPEDPSAATLRLDDPIFIKASKLFVLTYRGPIKSFSLADSYYSQISLQPVDADQIWPPPLIKDIDDFILQASSSPGERADPYTIHLIAPIPNLPQVPRREEWLRMAVTAGSRQCENLKKRFELQVDCGWSNPFSIYTVAPEAHYPQANRLPTPLSDKDVAPSRNVSVNYHFRRNGSDAGPDAVPGVNGALSGYNKFSVKGYTCTFCERKEFADCNRLHFHLVTCHDLFEFQVKQKKTPRGADAFADVWVDLSRRYSGVSEKTKDPKSFLWVRPREPFNLKQILDGNWRWLNEKIAPLAPHQLQLHRERGMAAGKRTFNPDNVKDLPARKKRKFIVPKPIHKLQGHVFIRGKSKRFCLEDEELSESDEEPDEDWLLMRHEETIDDFEDVGVNERTFMKMFDRHLFKERPIGYVHLPETLVRFARQNRNLLRSTNALVEFYKCCLNQIQYGMIDAEILQHCMQIIKGDEWNSTGKTDVGLGLAGPLPLDDVPPREKEKEGQSGGEVEGDNEQLSDYEMERDDSEGPEVKSEDITEINCPHAGCPCGRPYKRTEVIYCDGQVCCPCAALPGGLDHKLIPELQCGSRWFHLSCVQLEHRPAVWKCKRCS